MSERKDRDATYTESWRDLVESLARAVGRSGGEYMEAVQQEALRIAYWAVTEAYDGHSQGMHVAIRATGEGLTTVWHSEPRAGRVSLSGEQRPDRERLAVMAAGPILRALERWLESREEAMDSCALRLSREFEGRQGHERE